MCGEVAAGSARAAGDVGAVVDEKSGPRAARHLQAVRGQFIKRARLEILFAELDERDARSDCRVRERKNVLEIRTSRGAGPRRCAARNQVDNRLWQVERHLSEVAET